MDIIILLILVFFVFRGLRNGFLKEVLVLVGLFVGFFLAKHYASDFTPYMNFNIGDNVKYALAYGSIVIVTLIVASLLAHFLSAVLKFASLGFLDHILGGLFGALKGIIIVCFLIFVIQMFFDLSLLKDSICLPYYEKLMDIAKTYLSQNPSLLQTNFLQ